MINILYSIFLGLWRRWFGGGLDFLPDNRALKHIVGFCVGCGALWYMDYSWIQIVLAMLLLQAFYWAVGHGPAFDMSRHGKPDEELLKRYKKYFWNKLCEFMIPKKYWYGFLYDFLWMTFRYELPALLLSIILLQPYIAFAGLTTSLIYALCWEINDKVGLKKIEPTSLAEILTGFTTGILLTI